MPNSVYICLTMIIKNEQDIIIRCLDSALPVIDFVFITDTGSSDNTIPLVKSWIEKNKLNNKLIDGDIFSGNAFRNFGESRSESFTRAKGRLDGLIRGHRCYLLLLDADMELTIDTDFFDKRLLTNPTYELTQIEIDTNDRYTNIRLIDSSFNWVCECVTHEFWRASDCIFEPELLSSLTINDMMTGKNRENKYQRDLRLLLEAYPIERREDIKQRYAFYIARTYYSLHDYMKAIEWFNIRVKLGGWIEEIYYSKYLIAKCYSILYDNNPCDEYQRMYRNEYINAWLYRPIRAEPLFWLCVTEMKMNLFDDRRFVTQVNALCYMYLKQATKIKIPNDKLFIETNVYEWKCDYLLYICSFYAQDRKCGEKAYKRLMEKKDRIDDRYMKCICNFKRKYKW